MKIKILLLLILFFANISFATSAENPFFQNKETEYFRWEMFDVSCPLVETVQNIFTMKLDNEDADYNFRIRCFLDKEKKESEIYYTIINDKEKFLMGSVNDSFQYAPIKIKFSSTGEEFSGSEIKIGGEIRYDFIAQEGISIENFFNNKSFYFLIKNPLKRKEYLYNFKISQDSVDFESFKDFCSINYYDYKN